MNVSGTRNPPMKVSVSGIGETGIFQFPEFQTKFFKKMLWVDKHRPTTLVECNRQCVQSLLPLSKSLAFPHLLLYGPKGAGKLTTARAFIASVITTISATSSLQLGMTTRKYVVGQKTYTIPLVTSDYHYEFKATPDLHHEALHSLINTLAREKNKLIVQGSCSFKMLIILDAHLLKPQSQHALRRLMEIYSKLFRVIFITSFICRIIDPIQSRCYGLRIPAPSIEEVRTILAAILKKEGKKGPPLEISNRNLKEAIMTLEERVRFPDKKIFRLDAVLDGIVAAMIERKSFSAPLYEVIGCGFAEADLMMKLYWKLMAVFRTDGTQDVKKRQLLAFAIRYDLGIKTGSNALLQLEAFLLESQVLFV